MTRPKSLGASSEVASLNDLINMLNAGQFSESQPEPTVVPEPAPAPAPVVAAAPVAVAPRGNLYFFTGKLKAGKDYVAAKSGAKIFGFADPIYALATTFFGVEVTSTQNKDVPGMRAALQTIGQWGRGLINEKYPVTPARACFANMVRSMANSLDASSLVDWSRYGLSDDLWLSACLRRVDLYQKQNPDGRVAITNARFENEFNALKAAGFSHIHVMCSLATWKARLEKDGLTADSPSTKDISEAMASAIDNDVLRKISQARLGTKLSVIWNDSVPSPSPRLHSVESWLAKL